MSDGPARQLLPRRIGIHGVRNAGKTCFLGSLYGFRAGDTATVDFADDATCHYLAGIWKDLSEARVPGATLLAMPTHLRMDLLPSGDEGPATPLLLCDYAGLLVEPKAENASPAAHTLSAGVKAWFRSCHAVLVFLDSSRPDLEQLDALDLLLTELRRPGPDGPALERPVAIVLTKWDSQGTISTDLAREQARARDFLRAHHAFRQIGQKLDAGQIKVFPVSSFGNHARGTQPPDLARYHPCHLHAPLAWAAEASDLVLLEEAREVASRHMERGWHVLGVNLWPQPDHAAARRTWSDLKEQATPGHGPLAEQIDEELAALGSRRRQHWLGYLAAIAGLLALVVLGLNQAARAADAQAEKVVAYCEARKSPEDAEARLARADEFLASWGSRLVPQRREEVARLREEAAVTLEFQELARNKEWDKAHALISGFIERHPSSSVRDGLGATWVALNAGRLEEQNDFEGAGAAYRAFLEKHPESPRASEFEERVRQLKGWEEDRKAYERIRSLVGRGTAADLQEAAAEAKKYIESGGVGRPMRGEVERFWFWFNRLEEGGKYEVTVESITVPRSSVLNPVVVVSTREIRAHLTINGATDKTKAQSKLSSTPNEQLGPYPFKWGQPGVLELTVTSELWRRKAKATLKLEDPLFILGRANGTLSAKDDEKGVQVQVALKCPDAIPPRLPAYRRR